RFLLITGQMNPDCHVAKITLKRLRACCWADISTVMPICINPMGSLFFNLNKNINYEYESGQSNLFRK
ncbi:hypothetical protein LAC27_RS27360, partial [Escherichia coli]